jgi:hypothetical protein
MKRLCFFILFGGLLLNESRAAVISRDWKAAGDGLLTYDDVSNREWLDLTETQLFKFPGASLEEKFQAVLAETVPGGTLDQFFVAKIADVAQLAESAGINTESFRVDVNGQETLNLILLLGEAGTVSNPVRNRISGARAMDHNSQMEVASIVYAPGGLGTRPGPPVAGFYSTGGIDGVDVGVWLYRAIPEPSSYLSLLVGCLILFQFQSLGNCHYHR